MSIRNNRTRGKFVVYRMLWYIFNFRGSNRHENTSPCKIRGISVNLFQSLIELRVQKLYNLQQMTQIIMYNLVSSLKILQPFEQMSQVASFCTIQIHNHVEFRLMLKDNMYRNDQQNMCVKFCRNRRSLISKMSVLGRMDKSTLNLKILIYLYLKE